MKSYCSCCGVEKLIYEEQGHDKECIWYEDEMYKLAYEWLFFRRDEADWKKRYDLVVTFLLERK